MPVLLIPNTSKEQAIAVACRVTALLREYGVSVLVPGTQLAALIPGTEPKPEEEAYALADQVITVGGDGTLLRSGHACIRHHKPVLGVNLGRTGFLATCEVEELPQKLRRLAQGDYTVEERGLLQADLAEANWQAQAINDLVIFGESRAHPMDYHVYCDGAFVSHYRSDGLILATPTGSTAYSFSAGGPVLDAAAQVMVLTPVCAHNLHTAPLVFAADRRLEIVADAENRGGSYVCADSGPHCALCPGQRVTVTAAPDRLRLIAFQDSEQFCAIENKLMRR